MEIKSSLFMIAYRFFSIMPLSFLHAVFMPEDCLAVSSQFYIVRSLSHSIEGLKLQEDYLDISNEDLYDSIYNTLVRVLRGYSAITTSTKKAQIISSSSLFPDSSALITYDNLLKASLIDTLKSHSMTITLRAKKKELLKLLKDNIRVTEASSTGVECTL